MSLRNTPIQRKDVNDQLTLLRNNLATLIRYHRNSLPLDDPSLAAELRTYMPDSATALNIVPSGVNVGTTGETPQKVQNLVDAVLDNVQRFSRVRNVTWASRYRYNEKVKAYNKLNILGTISDPAEIPGPGTANDQCWIVEQTTLDKDGGVVISRRHYVWNGQNWYRLGGRRDYRIGNDQFETQAAATGYSLLSTSYLIPASSSKPNITVPEGLSEGEALSASDVEGFMTEAFNKTSQWIHGLGATEIPINITYCHSSCHASCHSSRSRR